MPNWTSFLKGIYDVEGLSPPLLVTGSARLDMYRRTGESMAGRFFRYRLHPFDVQELSDRMPAEDTLNRILTVGGFPEPFLANDEEYYRRWRRSHLEAILRRDLLDLTTVTDLHSVELLVEMLKERVGSPVSYASLSRDVAKDPKTVKRWLELLTELYVIFPVRPWHRNVARSLSKEPKYYFYDTAQVKDEGGARLENAVACSLLKTIHNAEDRDGYRRSLQFVRTRDGREIDFVVTKEGAPTHLLEVKDTDETLSRSFPAMREAFETARRVQLVRSARRAKTWPSGEELRPLAEFLADFNPDMT